MILVLKGNQWRDASTGDMWSLFQNSSCSILRQAERDHSFACTIFIAPLNILLEKWLNLPRFLCQKEKFTSTLWSTRFTILKIRFWHHMLMVTIGFCVTDTPTYVIHLKTCLNKHFYYLGLLYHFWDHGEGVRAYPSSILAKAGCNPEWVTNSSQHPMWAFVSLLDCSRVPCSDGVLALPRAFRTFVYTGA